MVQSSTMACGLVPAGALTGLGRAFGLGCCGAAELPGHNDGLGDGDSYVKNGILWLLNGILWWLNGILW